MVSLWGSKNNENDDGGDEAPATDGEGSRPHSRNPPAERRSRDADERTRLLPPRGEGYLDPDDPAVRLNIRPRVVCVLIFVSRYLHTTFGASGPYATSLSSSS